MTEALKQVPGGGEARDDLSALDTINFKVANELSKEPATLEVAADILVDVQKSDIAQIAREKSGIPFTERVPGSFAEMMDASIGTVWQRLQKWYFNVGDPEKNIKFFRGIGVDKYRDAAKWIVLGTIGKFADIKGQAREGKNTNYTLANPSFNSLLDFATNQTTTSEAFHLIGAAAIVPLIATETLIEGTPAVGASLFILNLYCIFAQRYTRSKLGIAIDRMLKEHPAFDAEKYENRLGIRLPPSRKSADSVADR